MEPEGKSITPPIISFEQLYTIYSEELKYKPALLMGKLNPELIEERNQILDILKKHKDVLDEIEDTILNFIQKAIRINPPVYVARTRDPKTDIEYFNAKTFIPLKGGKKKEIKIYLGRASDYQNDTMSENAKFRGKTELRKVLKLKMEQGKKKWDEYFK